VFDFRPGRGRPFVFGHRGAMTEAPENTIPSFLAAERLGVDGVELDVHLSRDGVPVVTHDPWIYPGRPQFAVAAHGVQAGVRLPYEALAAGGLSLALSFDAEGGALRIAHDQARVPTILVADSDWQDLRRMPQGYDASGRAVFMPRLEEVLDAISPETGVDIEIKMAPGPVPNFTYAGIVETVVAIVRACHREDTVLVSSFDHRVLRHAAQYAPEISLLANYSGRLVEPAAIARTIPTPNVSIGDVSEEEIAEHHAAGLTVTTSGHWSLEDFLANARWGVDAVVLDDPRFLAAL
jgi:glycerophosphoryl diester phosphodiesterase